MLGGVRNRSSTAIVTTAREPVEVARQEMKPAPRAPWGDCVAVLGARPKNEWRAGPRLLQPPLSYRRAGATFRTYGLREVFSGLGGAFFGLGRTRARVRTCLFAGSS